MQTSITAPHGDRPQLSAALCDLCAVESDTFDVLHGCVLNHVEAPWVSCLMRSRECEGSMGLMVLDGGLAQSLQQSGETAG